MKTACFKGEKNMINKSSIVFELVIIIIIFHLFQNLEQILKNGGGGREGEK